MSLIVVEGVDASGKSTLLENSRLHIKNRYFALLRHSCRPLSLLDVNAFLGLIRCNPVDLVVDRHPLISEPIYGKILRGHDLTEEIVNSDEILHKTVDRIIYCRPPVSLIRQNLDNKPQLALVKENINSLVVAYDHKMAALSRAGIAVYEYNYSARGTKDLESLFFGEV